jgi:hypothetical protein
MGSRFKEYAPAVAAILIGLAGFVWSDEATRWIESRGKNESERPVIGQLEPQGRGVRYRPESSVIWTDVVEANKEVRADDAIFTNQQTSARIDLREHGVLEMQPNSMIVLRGFEPGAKEPPRLVIEKGSIKVKAFTKRKPILVESRRKTFRLEVTPQSEGKDLTLSVRGERALEVADAVSDVQLIESDVKGAPVAATSPSPSPSPSPSVTPTPTPTPTPMSTATPTPTPRSTPRPTPRPTATPRPTPVPTPTPTPRPTATPKPTPTPKPKPTPTPYLEEDVFIRGISIPEKPTPRPTPAPETPGL